MENRFFQTEELQTQFEQDGFVKIKLLNPKEVETLATAYELFQKAHEGINIPYITTSHTNNSELITNVDQVLQKTMAPAISNYLVNYKLLFGNYLVKMPGLNSETNPHQDITFVDEVNFVSANIWVALEDTDEKNGCMYFLKGSHKFIPTIRPTHDYRWTYENVIEDIKRESISFPVKAGDAFIFHHAVIHGSFQNRSKKPRLAAVVAAYTDTAPLIHYFLPNKGSNLLQKYSMNKEAYLHFEKEMPPKKGVFLKEEKYPFKQISKEEFQQFLKSVSDAPAKKVIGFIKRLFE